MWPLPQLPTDHLYKLLTFVGMAMVVGAFYIMPSGGQPFEETGNHVYARMVILVDRLTDAGLGPKPLAENISKEEIYDRYKEYRDLIRKLPASRPEATELRDMNEQILMERIKSRQGVGWQDLRKNDVYALLCLGYLLLTIGFFWWYHGFQRYQDAIMRLSAIEAQRRAYPAPSDEVAC